MNSLLWYLGCAWAFFPPRTALGLSERRGIGERGQRGAGDVMTPRLGCEGNSSAGSANYALDASFYLWEGVK